MKSSKLHDWLEVVGIFAVVASLVFVGLEMRQAHEISLSEAYQSRVASVVEWNSALAANTVALSAYRKAANGAAEEMMNPVAYSIFVGKAKRGARPGFRDVVLSISEELKTESDD